MSDALGPPESTWTTSAYDNEVDEVSHFGFTGFNARGDHEVYVEEFEILGLPPAVEVVAMFGVDASVPGTILLAGPWDLQDWGRALHPIEDVVLYPSSPDDDYWILVCLAGREPGTYISEGVRITYSAGGRRGVAVYEWRVEMEVLA